jgi:hypothetical protein
VPAIAALNRSLADRNLDIFALPTRVVAAAKPQAAQLQPSSVRLLRFGVNANAGVRWQL